MRAAAPEMLGALRLEMDGWKYFDKKHFPAGQTNFWPSAFSFLHFSATEEIWFAAREMGGSSAPEMGLALRLEIFVFRNYSAARATDVPALCKKLTSPSPLGERVPKAGEGLHIFY